MIDWQNSQFFPTTEWRISQHFSRNQSTNFMIFSIYQWKNFKIFFLQLTVKFCVITVTDWQISQYFMVNFLVSSPWVTCETRGVFSCDQWTNFEIFPPNCLPNLSNYFFTQLKNPAIFTPQLNGEIYVLFPAINGHILLFFLPWPEKKLIESACQKGQSI